MELRVGQGIDIHQFVEGRKLILGGIEISYNFGLMGHSDADVLLHAITDALLGAAGLGDIGILFPNSDDRWKNADSSIFLTHAVNLLKKDNWRVINVDCTVLAEAPKLSPYREKIQKNIAQLLEISENCVSLKATTTEKLGFVGRSEGMLASCNVLIQR